MVDDKQKKPEEKKSEEKVDAPKAGVVKPKILTAKNITKRRLNLTHGQIEPGRTGKATAAEVSMLSGKHLEVVK